MKTYLPYCGALRTSIFSMALACFLWILASPAAAQLTINDSQTAEPPDEWWNNWDYTGSEIYIGFGEGASGELIVPAGADVIAGSWFLGSLSPTASGSLEINGEGAMARVEPESGSVFHIGSDGFGEVLVTNGGQLLTAVSHIGFNPGSSGKVTVSGGGSYLTSAAVRLGQNPGASGTMTVTGAGSSLGVGSFLHVGSDGDGSLHILDGATVSAGLINAGNAGVSVPTGQGVGGEFATGHLHVSGEGSLLETTTWVILGRGDGDSAEVGSSGTLLVENGGTVRTGTYARLGGNAGTTGEATVTGAGSAIEPGTFFQVGFRGTGSLLVTDGGRLEVAIDGGSISSVGRHPTGVGEVTIEGEGSFIQAPRLAMGSDTNLVPTGVGTMLIRDNGELILGGLLGLRNGSTVELDNGTITMVGEINPVWPDLIDIQGENSRIFGNGTILSDVLVADGGTVTGVGAGIEIDGVLMGGGSVDNLTVSGVQVMPETGLLFLNNVAFREDAVVHVAITDFSDPNNLLAYDSNTSLAGTHLEVSFSVVIDDPDWTAQILPAGVDHGFASVTLPDGWAYEDGLLSVAGEGPPPPPPAFVANYTGATVDNNNWTHVGNWDTDIFPDAPNAIAQFGALIEDTDRANILFSSSLLAIPAVLELASIRILPELNTTAPTFLIRNFSTGTAGTLRLYGYPEMLGDVEMNLLIGNFGYGSNVLMSPANAGMVIELNGSGAFHNEGEGLLRVSTEITEAGDPRSITKTGPGILRFDRRNVDHSSQHSTYSGGFTLTDGIVEWTHSGDDTASPFGIGPLTLRAGTLRSTTDSGRSLNTSIVLDGGATIGSLEEGFLGNITVNSHGGTQATTIVSDSTLNMLSFSNWHQGTSGEGALVKTGPDTLVFTGTGGTVDHTGPTTIAEGMLRLNTTISGSPVTVQSGGSLGFGLSGETGLGIVNSPLTLEEGGAMVFRLGEPDEETPVNHDSLQVSGDLNLEGGALVVELGYTPEVNDSFLLIENWAFTAPNGVFTHGGTPLAEGARFSVFSGDFSQQFEISYQGGTGFDVVITALGEAVSSPFDDWAAGFGLTGADALPGANPSGDGFSNAAKFAFGASPLMAVPALAEVEASAEGVTLRWNRLTVAGATYRIERSPTLEPGSWEEVEGAVPALVDDPGAEVPEGYERVEWTAVPAEGKAFYRVVSVLEPSLLP